jgi:hypothetical protein
LIGREWKYSDVRSGPVLIDRGLDYIFSLRRKHFYAVVRIRKS